MNTSIVSASEATDAIVDWASEGKSVDEIESLVAAHPSLQYITRDGIVEILNSVRSSSTITKVKEVVSDPTSMGYAGKRIVVTARIANKLGIGVEELLNILQDDIKNGQINNNSVRPVRELGAMYIAFIQLLREELIPYQGEVKVTETNEIIRKLEQLSPDQMKETINKMIESKQTTVKESILSPDGTIQPG